MNIWKEETDSNFTKAFYVINAYTNVASQIACVL